ncbi:MAG: hypothetical protein Q7S40_01050 [Opitutaceae bacterium]|nr:hypothetical protein [Opitutaceae bacterium]
MRNPSLIVCGVLAFLCAAPVIRAWNSTLVTVDASGRLTFPADANGNRIPDFSHAGYRGGGVPLPVVPIVRTLAPAAGDQTARIQAALDEVGALPVQADGYRGTLQLAAGTWEVLGTIRLNRSGVVLAGAGNGDDPASNTILRRTGISPAAIIQAGTRDDSFRSEVPNTRSQVTTSRVTVGSRSFEVDHPEYYRVGDAVILWIPGSKSTRVRRSSAQTTTGPAPASSRRRSMPWARSRSKTTPRMPPCSSRSRPAATPFTSAETALPPAWVWWRYIPSIHERSGPIG